MGIFDFLKGRRGKWCIECSGLHDENDEICLTCKEKTQIEKKIKKQHDNLLGIEICKLNGELKKKSFNGEPYNGECYELHKNGEVLIIGNYKKGKQVGVWKTYYDNGQLDILGQYNNGKMNGKFKFYYKDGVLSRETNYKEGKEDGLSIQWYHDGEKEYEQIWTNGDLQTEKKWISNKNICEPDSFQLETISERGIKEIKIEELSKKYSVRREKNFEVIEVNLYYNTGTIFLTGKVSKINNDMYMLVETYHLNGQPNYYQKREFTSNGESTRKRWDKKGNIQTILYNEVLIDPDPLETMISDSLLQLQETTLEKLVLKEYTRKIGEKIYSWGPDEYNIKLYQN